MPFFFTADSSREKNQALNFLRLASRIDAVASRVETAVRMRSVTASMANIVRGMDQALQTMDMQKITMVRPLDLPCKPLTHTR